jgi:hypothetical protein
MPASLLDVSVLVIALSLKWHLQGWTAAVDVLVKAGGFRGRTER